MLVGNLWRFGVSIRGILALSGHVFCRRCGGFFRNRFANADNFLAGVSKAAEALGLGSVAVTLIFANLDNRIYGLFLRDLIVRFFPNYYGVFAGTLAVTLLCLGSAEWGKLTLVLPLLVLLVLCCVVHLYVLYHFVFRTSLRRTHALEEWERQISKAAEPEEVVNLAYGVSNVILAEPEPYSRLAIKNTELSIYDCFSNAIFRLTEVSSGKDLFWHMSSAWTYILRQELPREKLLFMLKNALKKAGGEEHGNAVPMEKYGTVLLGFFCAEFQLAKELAGANTGCREFLPGLQILITDICDAMDPFAVESWHYLYAAYVLTVLMYRTKGEYNGAVRELAKFIPMRENDPAFGVLKNEKELFGDMFRVPFKDMDVDAYCSDCIDFLDKLNRAHS